MQSIDRREFVRRFGGLAGLGLVSCSTQVDQPPRIVVVGAGISGLVAAYELLQAGYEVTVLEARDRVGGRVLSIRSPFASGHYVDAGAARIPPEHDLTLRYARQFGLELDRFYPATGFYLRFRSGERTLVPADDFLRGRPNFVKIRGGSDRLPAAFAAALGERVVTDSPVTDITAGSPVGIRCGNGQTYEADAVLVTVPLPLLSSIRFSPALSTAKTKAMHGGFDYQSATRVFVRFRTRFWEGEDLNGWGITDWPEELWHPTWDAPDPEGVLLTYVFGSRANELDELDDDARVARVLEHWEEFLPGVSGHVVSGTSHSWQRDPWSRAAWAWPTRMQDVELGDELARPEGPIHFAGEHISGARGWMQGAFESGLRAVAEIEARMS